jgi:hypothetical protein
VAATDLLVEYLEHVVGLNYVVCDRILGQIQPNCADATDEPTDYYGVCCDDDFVFHDTFSITSFACSFTRQRQ